MQLRAGEERKTDLRDLEAMRRSAMPLTHFPTTSVTL